MCLTLTRLVSCGVSGDLAFLAALWEICIQGACKLDHPQRAKTAGPGVGGRALQNTPDELFPNCLLNQVLHTRYELHLCRNAGLTSATFHGPGRRGRGRADDSDEHALEGSVTF